MGTEAVPPKLSQEAGSISSTDTSEIGFGLPVCRRRHPRRPFAALISQKKRHKVVKDRKGDDLSRKTTCFVMVVRLKETLYVMLKCNITAINKMNRSNYNPHPISVAVLFILVIFIWKCIPPLYMYIYFIISYVYLSRAFKRIPM